VTVDGYNITTPVTFTWTVGDNHTIAANSPVAVVPDQSRYIYSGWSDGGKQSHTIIVPSQATTYTANFQLQYYLTVSGGYSTTGQGWYDDGTLTAASSNWLQSVQGNTTGLVGLWHFDEGSGTTAYESSGNGNNGTIYGASWVAGKYGEALSFSGSHDSYVNVFSMPTLNQLSVECWAKISGIIPPPLDWQPIIHGANPTASALSSYEIFFNPAINYLLVSLGGTSNPILQVPYTFQTEVWYFVTLTYDGSIAKVYINGILFQSWNTTGSITNQNGLTIATDGAYCFNGTVDEVRTYNRALSPSEISSSYYNRMAVTNWQLAGADHNPTRQNRGTLTTSSITMNCNHNVTFVPTTQYYLTVNGGDSVSFGVASPTGDQWYDSGTSTTVSTNWVWGAVAGQSRTAVTNWQLDGANQNTPRQGSGNLTTPPINMSTYHILDFVSGTQYCLTVSGGFNVVLSQASPTGDSFYDVGSILTVTTDYAWGVTNGNTRQNLFSYTLDGATTNVTRMDGGNFSSPAITIKSPYELTFNSVTQYLVSFQPMDNSGTEAITPSSFQIEINDLGVTSVPELEMWLDDGTKFQIRAVIWENANVKPTNQPLYVVNAPLDEAILDRVFDAKLVVTDYFGIPVSGALVTSTLANGTAIQLTTGSDGTLSLGLIPIGTFRATISYLGTTTEANGNVSIQPAVTVKVFASYPTFSLIGGGIAIAAVGSVLVRWYRRSPALQDRFKAYVRMNWGAPFIVGFIVLLMFAATYLSMGLAVLADEVAVYAFYALVVGVILQLVCFLKYNKGND
jgi:hypothetical protein